MLIANDVISNLIDDVDFDTLSPEKELSPNPNQFIMSKRALGKYFFLYFLELIFQCCYRTRR